LSWISYKLKRFKIVGLGFGDWGWTAHILSKN